MNIGDRVRIHNSPEFGEDYPFIPDLEGLQGIIKTLTTFDLEPEVLVEVTLDKEIMVRYVKPGRHCWRAAGEDLTDPEPKIDFWCLGEELELV